MIESVTAREAEALFSFIDSYKVEMSAFKLINPFEPEESNKFSNKWIMVNDERITAGDPNRCPPNFWAKRDRSFPYSWFNRNLKGANRAVETECVSFTIDIPFTSHRSFLKLFLLIDEEANTEKKHSEKQQHHNIFDVELVKVSVIQSVIFLVKQLYFHIILIAGVRVACLEIVRHIRTLARSYSLHLVPGALELYQLYF